MTLGAEAVVQLVTAGPRPAIVLSLDRREADAPVHFGLLVDGRPTGIRLALSPATSVWSPETFLPIVSGLTPGLKPDPTPADPALIGELTDGRVETIARAAVRVSTELSAHRRSPALHEAAALILTALAFRDGNRLFDDPRAILTRAAAHLAVADALRGRTSADRPLPATTSSEGGIARSALAALAGRQTEALGIVESLRQASPSPAVASWLRAIEVRTRLDWRVLQAPEKATLIERLEHTRALDARLGPAEALAFVTGHPAEPVVGWGRVLFEEDFAVESGNLFASVAIEQELAEAAAVHQIVRGAPLDAARLAVALNQPPTRGPRVADEGRVEVLDWPLWADVLQRHVANALLAESTHLRHNLGIKEDASEYEATQTRRFRDLRLFPFVSVFFNQGKGLAAGAAALHPVWERPQLVPSRVWLAIHARSTTAKEAIRIAPTAQWFAPAVPLGTAPEDVWLRSNAELGRPEERVAALPRWRAMAPHKRALAMDALAVQYGQDIPADALARELAPFLEMDMQANRRLAQASANPAERDAPYRRMCALSVDQCSALVWHLIDQERNEQAAEVFRRFVDGARDRVRASGTDWLVQYEYDHGRASEAWRIARESAAIGSGGGIAALAALSERTGALDQAEALYQQIARRYDHVAPLLAFYLRARGRGDTRYAVATEALLAKHFPKGLERASLQDFTDGVPPDAGVTVEGPFWRLSSAGVRHGDVIVAFDGYRVRNVVQRYVLHDLSRDPAMAFVYYRDGRYFAAEGRFPARALADRFRSWCCPQSATPGR